MEQTLTIYLEVKALNFLDQLNENERKELLKIMDVKAQNGDKSAYEFITIDKRLKYLCVAYNKLQYYLFFVQDGNEYYMIYGYKKTNSKPITSEINKAKQYMNELKDVYD